MLLTTEVFQNKPPSLEEGPMRCSAHNENCVFHRVEKRSILQQCMEVIKLILYLEVIFLVALLGMILISNYHVEYYKDITAHDSDLNNFNGADFPITSHVISNDDGLNSVNDVEAMGRTERSHVSTTSEMTLVFSNSDDPLEDNEWPLFKIFHRKNGLTTLPSDNVDLDIFGENMKNKMGNQVSPKVKITDDLEDPSLLFPNSGLIHVIEDRVYDSNDDLNIKSEVPFPLLPVLDNNKAADEEKDKLKDNKPEDSGLSEVDSLLKILLNGFEEISKSPEPAVKAPTEDYDFNMKEILIQPKDLTRITEDLNSNDDPVSPATTSAPQLLDHDEMIPSGVELHIRGSFHQPAPSTEGKNIFEQSVKSLLENDPVVDDSVNDIDREIMRIFQKMNENFY